MKVNFFHLMPYRYLPQGFAEKYRSVWVDIPSHLFDPVKGGQLYNEYMDELEYAEQLGFDGICVNEHHSNGYGLMPSPNIIAAGLVRRTSRAAIIVLGDSIALYNPPIRVAEEFAMLDCISGGRLVAGFPVGTSMDDNFAYGIAPIELRERYREAHDLIIQAWTRPEVFAFNGKYTQLRYVNIWPRPIQKPHPPVWIPGGGSLETWDWAASNNYSYCALSYFGYLGAKQTVDGFWDVNVRIAGDDNPHRLGFLQLIAVADSDAEAERLYSEHVDYFYNNLLHVYEGFADAPGYRTLKTIQHGLRGQVGRRARLQREGLTWKEFVERGYVIAGSPATVRDRLTEAIKSLRIGHLMALCQIGSMPRELAMHNMEMFATEVMPHIKPIFEEYEDHWWPKPALELETAAV